MPTSPARTWRALACALSLTLILSGCETIRGALGGTERARVDVAAVGCRSFKRIDPSRQDTDGTLRQIHEHNAVWAALCDPELAPAGAPRSPPE